MPNPPNSKNQRNMKVPNERPMYSVPNCWTKKIMVIMTIITGITGKSGLMPSRPSMAVVTVMAGVMIPSANKVLAPMMAMA